MQRLAVLADIHGNSWALRAVLEDLEGRGRWPLVNLGDVFFGPLDPAGTAELLRGREIPTVSGNQDRLLWEQEEPASPTHAQVLAELPSEDLRWLRQLPGNRVLSDAFLCHGTPSRDDEYLLEEATPHGARLRPSEAVAAELGGVGQSLVLCGHSHKARSVQLPAGSLVVNPGSVGLPAYTAAEPYPHAMESGSPHARYALLERGERGWHLELVAVPYDWRAAARRAEASGRSDWARWIASGRGS